MFRRKIITLLLDLNKNSPKSLLSNSVHKGILKFVFSRKYPIRFRPSSWIIYQRSFSFFSFSVVQKLQGYGNKLFSSGEKKQHIFELRFVLKSLTLAYIFVLCKTK